MKTESHEQFGGLEVDDIWSALTDTSGQSA